MYKSDNRTRRNFLKKAGGLSLGFAGTSLLTGCSSSGEKQLPDETGTLFKGKPDSVEDRIERVFDRFYQVDSSNKRKFQGAGLGLWISKKIIEAHGGRIWAESKNRGSTFHILL